MSLFWCPNGAPDRLQEFNSTSPDTLFGKATSRVELEDGSTMNIIDASAFHDFINEHAWFEGDEVALPREDRLCLLGNLTGRTPRKNKVHKPLGQRMEIHPTR